MQVDFLAQITAQITAQVNAQVEAQLRERDATIQMLQEAHDAPLVMYEGGPVDEAPEIVVGSKRYPYPTPPQQHERAVWRNREFVKYLKSIGLEGRAVLPQLATSWFKRRWFGDARLGAQRLANAGFAPEQLAQLTTHHIVPADLGGRDSIYNFHLVLAEVNAHLGSMFTKESVAWVGAEHAHVAKSFAKFANRQTVDGLDARKFDPFALACPKTAIGKRRLMVTDTIAGAPCKQARLGALLEVWVARPEPKSPTPARVEEVDDQGSDVATQPTSDDDGDASGASPCPDTTPSEIHTEETTLAAYPKDVNSLLAAIAERDFGVDVASRVSTFATPAMAALKKASAKFGLPLPYAAAVHKKGMPLAEGYHIVKVCYHDPTVYPQPRVHRT